MNNIAGIYKIENKANGKIYIGSSVNIKYRIRRHKQDLEKGVHKNEHLQRAWNSYGDKSFQFSVILICDKENTLIYEQIALNSFCPEYNMSGIAGKIEMTKDVRDKISKSLTGSRGGFLGHTHTKEARMKISKASKGNKYALGYKHTEEWKKKKSEAAKGNNNRLGHKHTEEWKNQKSKEMQGNSCASGHSHQQTDETKKKISESLKRYYENNKSIN